MRKVMCAIAALCTAVSLASIVVADASSEARKAIQAAYDRSNAAAAKKDLAGTFAVLAPEAVFILPNGQKFTSAMIRQQYSQLFAAAQSIKGTTKIEKFTLKGKEATATTREHSEMVLSNPQNHKTAKMAEDATSEDTWVKTGKGWLLKQSKVLTQKQTLNGKPFPGGM